MIELVPATEAHLAEVVALTNRAFRGAGGEAGWSVETMIAGERINEAMLRADIAAAPQAHLLTWRDATGDLLGHVWMEPQPDRVWYLGMLSVRPDRQDQQLGRTLLGAAEDFARARGAQRIQMTVIHQRDTLIAWYERRGYRRTGETRPFPYGDDRFGQPLRADLYFDVLERDL